ncbi:MAG: HAD family hydrolase [Promethearchaeota archaeon]
MPSNHYKAILFDLHGTLVEIFKKSEYESNVQEIAKILGLDLVNFKQAWKKSWENFPFGDYESVEKRFRVALEYYQEKHSIPDISKKTLKKAIKARSNYIEGQLLKIRPGLIDALEWIIKQGYKIGLVSNCSMETVLSWPKNPLSRYFPDPSFSCLIKIKKPDAEIFLHALNKIEIYDPEKVIYVCDGDDNEIDTAMDLGMKVVLFTYDTEDAFRHLSFPEAEYSISHFQQLPGIIESLERKI